MTKIENEFRPDYAIPPGETLLEVLESIGMTQAELARRTGRPKKTINEIIQGKTTITPETALQLELTLRIPASFWNNREQQYQETLARLDEEEQLEEQVHWLEDEQIPVDEMCQRGWIEFQPDRVDLLREVLRFFGLASIYQFETYWHAFEVVFRRSAVRPANWGAVAAWLRKGEIEAQAIDCLPYDAATFRRILPDIRILTRQKVEEVLPDIMKACAAVGIAVVVIPALTNTAVSGATRWLTPEKALLQLSLRYRSDDNFWFSFFHESGHILLHGKKKVFLEPDKLSNDVSELEEEANNFARNLLIPPNAWNDFLIQVGNKYPSRKKVIAFANDLGIAPSIVVGRLHHDRVMPPSHLNDLRWRLEMDEIGHITSVPYRKA